MIEAIIKLPKDLFYHAGITFYFWILNKNKDDSIYNEKSRKVTIQFIDGTNFYKKYRLTHGFKLNAINYDNIKELLDIYHGF